MPAPHLDWIRLESLSFPCILGIYGWEQTRPQSLELEIALGLDLDPAAAGDLQQSVNYVDVLDRIQFLAQEGRWQLLESMAAAMARHLLMPPAPGEERGTLQAVKIRLRKPQVLQGRGVPSVEICRDAAWCRESLPKPGQLGDALVQPLMVTPQSAAYHVRIPGGASWQSPADMTLKVLAGQVVEGGMVPMILNRGGHRLVNQLETPCTLLALSQPPLASLEAPWQP